MLQMFLTWRPLSQDSEYLGKEKRKKRRKRERKRKKNSPTADCETVNFALSLQEMTFIAVV